MVAEAGIPAADTAPTERGLHMAEWTAAAPSTPEAIAAFYQKSDHLAGDLAELHALPHRAAWREMLAEVVRQYNPRAVLDVGAGGGHDLLAVKAAAPAAWRVAVEPNDRLRAELERSCAAHLAVASWEELTERVHAAVTPFDLVLCIDVLEHLPRPERFVARLIERVPAGGLLVEATATHNTWTATHLPENWGWLPAGQLRRAGFTLLRSRDYCNVWQRTRLEGPRLGATLIAFVYRFLSPKMADQLLAMQRAGWDIQLAYNDALITRARSQQLTEWWRQSPHDVCLMVDADITFSPEDAAHVVEVARRERGIAVGAYALRGGASISSRPLADQQISFRKDAPPVPVEWGATGFMAIHRDVVEAMRRQLPLCHPTEAWSFFPFFDPPQVPKITAPPASAMYLSEDWHFCDFARRLGFPMLLDPSVLLGHVGDYEYTLYDVARRLAGQEPSPGTAVTLRQVAEEEVAGATR